jgi:putative copper export protein
MNMATKHIFFAVEIFLHDLASAAWIGGLLALGIVVLPAVKKVLGKGPQTKQLMKAIQKRLSVLVYISIVILIVTGLQQAKHVGEFQGLFSFQNTFSTVLSVKHILVLAMVGIALYRSLVLDQNPSPQNQFNEKLSASLLLVNMVLGVAVLLLSGFSAAL